MDVLAGSVTANERAGVDLRVDDVTAVLRQTLAAVAEGAVGAAVRPSRLVTRLQLDKSLASRLVRALRSESASEMIHFLPSPTGLHMFVDAAAGAGVHPTIASEARDAIGKFQSLLDEFPGGRSALETWVSAGMTPVRSRAERAAKQAVHRAMSHLLGFHCEVVTSALILQPASDGATVDGLEVSRRAGVRRVRPDTPVALFSIDLTTGRTDGPSPRLAPLDPGADHDDPASYLVPRFCDPTTPALDILRQGNHSVFALSDSLTSVHQPVTVTSAMAVRSAWSRFRSEQQVEDGREYLLHYPCKLLIRDLFLRDDLYLGVQPEVSWKFPTPGAGPQTSGSGLPQRLNSLEMWSPIEYLGLGPGRWIVPDVPEHSRLIAHAFGTSGWDPGRFRGYRARVAYPVPMISMGWRIPLPTQG